MDFTLVKRKIDAFQLYTIKQANERECERTLSNLEILKSFNFSHAATIPSSRRSVNDVKLLNELKQSSVRPRGGVFDYDTSSNGDLYHEMLSITDFKETLLFFRD